MKRGRTYLLALASALLATSAPVSAEAPADTISAADPGAIVLALTNAGFAPELKKDLAGDPLIISRGRGAVLSVFFFGCDETTHDKCQAIRLQVGYDRAKPWNAADAMQLSARYPFLAVRLDEDGDPFVHWDLHLAEPIPLAAFIANVREFERAVTFAADFVYAEEMMAPKGP